MIMSIIEGLVVIDLRTTVCMSEEELKFIRLNGLPDIKTIE